MKWFKKLFCNHFYLMTRWHWSHGPNGNDPGGIECEFRCVKCGKTVYTYITSDDCDINRFAEYYSDKQEL